MDYTGEEEHYSRVRACVCVCVRIMKTKVQFVETTAGQFCFFHDDDPYIALKDIIIQMLCTAAAC